MKADPRTPHAAFAAAGLDPSSFMRSDGKSVRGKCWCGGTRRLVVWLDKLNYQCDICGVKGFLKNDRPSPDTLAELKAKSAAAAVEHERQVERARSEFTAGQLWEAYHRRMADEQYQWWQTQGIPRSWVDFYHMGYVPDKVFGSPEGQFHSAAFTIPIFDTGWKVINTQYRIHNPPEGVGRYRQEYGLPAAAFLSRPDLPLADSMIVVEGAKKAAVLCIGLPNQPQIVGLPGAMSWAGMDERLQGCGRVYILLDPDARAASIKLAKAIGPQARIVETPVKPDDAMLGGATPDDMRQLFKYARAVH